MADEALIGAIGEYTKHHTGIHLGALIFDDFALYRED